MVKVHLASFLFLCFYHNFSSAIQLRLSEYVTLYHVLTLFTIMCSCMDDSIDIYMNIFFYLQREADEEVVTLDVDPEGEGSLCKEHDLYLKEDVGMICKSCALVVISIENLVPSLVSL